jgi:hypothetical protein
MEVWTIEEMAAFKRSVFDNFESLPFNNKEITIKFIEYLDLIGIEGEEIFSFFEEYDNNCGYYLYENFEEYYQYYRMFFWRIGFRANLDVLHYGVTPLEVKENRFIREIAKYILKNEEDLLVKEIKEYLQKKLQDCNDYFDNRINLVHDNYKNIVKSFAPCNFFRERIENELYPIELFEKIKQVIPVEFSKYFKYELYDVHNDNKDHYSSHSDRWNEGIETSEQKEILVIESKTNWTKKDFYDKWEILVSSNEEDLYLHYADLITKWKEHLPVKLLRKEFESGNIACIEGILHSENEYAVRTLFAYAKKHSEIIPYVKKTRLNKELANVDFGPGENIYLTEKPTNVDYYKLLIKFFATSEEIANYIAKWYSGYIVTFIMCDDTDLCRKYSQRVRYILSDISSIIDSNIAIWEKIKGAFNFTADSITKQIFYDPFFKVISDEYNEMEEYDNAVEEDDEGCIGEQAFMRGYIFGQRKYKKIDKNKAMIPIWQIKICRRYYYKQYSRFRFWLYEHKELDLRGLELDDDAYKEFVHITLEKPFFFPEDMQDMYGIVSENGKFVEKLYTKKSFRNFEQEEKNKYSRRPERLWMRYWQEFIEDASRNFKQPEFEKPLLPIIPEYAEYLLSRTNDMFSTAIENIPYVEYKVFLTESRKSQIKLCLKSKITKNGKEEDLITKGEADELIKLAENSKTNYYAWSDEEIKTCLSQDTDSDKLNKINAILEPEFMVRVFEKSILWVMEHRDSELWQEL